MSIAVRRVYSEASSGDGFRILVDRMWPRGLSKENAHVDLWLKEVAPTSALRTWFAHDPAKWPEFVRRYHRELESHPDAVEEIRRRGRKGKVTLLFGARDEQHNNAVALRSYLTGKAS